MNSLAELKCTHIFLGDVSDAGDGNNELLMADLCTAATWHSSGYHSLLSPKSMTKEWRQLPRLKLC